MPAVTVAPPIEIRPSSAPNSARGRLVAVATRGRLSARSADHRPNATVKRARRTQRPLVFLATFFVGWLVLDRLVTAPPTTISASIAAAAAAAVLVVGELVEGRRGGRQILADLGLGLPVWRAVIAAVVVGGAVVGTFLVGAAAVGVELELRSNWPTVLVGVLLFHGVAEELVWRGYTFGHLRRRASFRQAIIRSIPLVALTHVPIVVTNGVGVGVLAVLTAAITCLPFSYLWERGGRTIWAPAIVHGLIGTWQLFERTYPVEYSVVILVASIVTPLAAFAFGDRWFAARHTPRPTAPAVGPHEGT